MNAFPISQSEAARRIGVPQQTVAQWVASSGIVRLAEHPHVNEADLSVLVAVARARASGRSLQQIRQEIAYESGKELVYMTNGSRNFLERVRDLVVGGQSEDDAFAIVRAAEPDRGALFDSWLRGRGWSSFEDVRAFIAGHPDGPVAAKRILYASEAPYSAGGGAVLTGRTLAGLSYTPTVRALSDRAAAVRESDVDKLRAEIAQLRRELGRTGDPAFDSVIRRNHELRAGAAPVDPAAPKTGESAEASVLRRFAEHKSQCAVEGRKSLGIQAWMAHDRVLHEQVHLMAEREEAAPRLARETQRKTLLAEVEERAELLMSVEPKFRGKKGQAMSEVLKRDENLRARYNKAHIADGKL